jgi:hypothetical protein
MRWITLIIFAVLAVLCGIWAFAGGFTVGAVLGKVLFWAFLVLFFLALLGGWKWRPRSRPGS